MDATVTEVPDGTVTTPQGFRAGATDAGIRSGAPGRLDLALLASDRPCAASAVFTLNALRGAPLIVTERHLADGRAQAVVANSGIANALNGPQGVAWAEEMAALAAGQLGLAREDIVVASTGVTGWPLPIDRVRAALPRIRLTEDGGDAFAHAIMTTDTVAKQAAAQFVWDGTRYTVGGAAKGAGMIHPDLATMLAFFTTDAPVDLGAVRRALRETVAETFNQLTVDGDTSPNDMVVLLANGAAGGEPWDMEHPAFPTFCAALRQVATTLTRKLARDGEGATKLIEVQVDGAIDREDARRAARAVAGSLLVKAAVYGNDPNWGRVLVALGASGARVEERSLTLAIQDVEVYRAGQPTTFDEGALARELAHSEVRFHLDLGLGRASARAWGCDLTPEYVRINSEYTT